LNFVSAGSIGGDVFKAIFLAHDHPGRRTEAIATIIADRVMGLLTMLLMATCGIFASRLLQTGDADVKALATGILVLSAVCWFGCTALLVFSWLTGVRVRRRAEKIPIVGRTVARLLATVQVYRRQKKMLLAAFSLSLIMGVCYASSYYLVA